jgi:predicted nucleic acid-binding Zn ribbon protein
MTASARVPRLEALSQRLSAAREKALLRRHAPAAAVLATLPSFQRLGLNESLFFLRQHWPHFVGDALARHSTPRSLKEGVLSVDVESPLFRQELTYAIPRILRIAQDHLAEGMVRSVKAQR